MDYTNPQAPTSALPKTAEHYTFNVPVNAAAAQQCGRVVFSDFHVNTDATGSSFPGECTAGPLTAQEKILEYMLFDLGNCISPDKPLPPPNCTAIPQIDCVQRQMRPRLGWLRQHLV